MLEVTSREGYTDTAKILLENKVEPTPLAVKVIIYLIIKEFFFFFFFFFFLKNNNIIINNK